MALPFDKHIIAFKAFFTSGLDYYYRRLTRKITALMLAIIKMG